MAIRVVEINRGVTVGVLKRVAVRVGVIGRVEVNVRAGLRSGARVSRGKGRRRRRRRRRRKRLTLSLRRKRKDRRSLQARSNVEKPTERNADGTERVGIRRVGVGKSVAAANGFGEKVGSVAAESDRIELLELRAGAAHRRKPEGGKEFGVTATERANELQ